MKEYFEIFCSNDEDEIIKVKSAFQENEIAYNISVNNTDNVIFGITPISNTRDLSYKYQIQVLERDLDKAENVIKNALSFDNDTENDLSETNSSDVVKGNHIANLERQNIARSILLLLIFCHFSRYFEFVTKNIKNRKNKTILYISGAMLILVLILLPSINYVQWFGIISGLLCAVFIVVIFQFFINLIDYIITRNNTQGYSWLILMGLTIIIALAAKFVSKSS